MKTQTFLCRATICLIFIAYLFSSGVNAQYNTAIGLRIGGTTGIDGKFFTRQSKAIEGIIGWFGNGSSLTVLVEKYSSIDGGLYVYYGGGPHLAFYNGSGTYYGYFSRDVGYHPNNSLGIGIDGIVGLEYRIPGVPISFSADVKPFLELGAGGYVGTALDPSLGVKFIFR
jgi:hypothetical protein